MSARRRRQQLGAVVLAGLALPIAIDEPSARAADGPLVPAGMTTLVADAAWSWFEDERAIFTGDGRELATSAVAGAASTVVAPGTVVAAQLDLASGHTGLVDLGRGEVDDHNSASLYEGDDGELTTSWSRHHRDALLRTQRRRTDGSWLRLPPIPVTHRSTYSNLRAAADAGGQPILYNFFRGVGFDPQALASADGGRRWVDLGRVLRDPLDLGTLRPYVQYAPAVDGRIDLIATETHPRESQTSLYHGYIVDGIVHDSAGAVLGPLGSAIPVTALTRVWAPTNGADRAWTADVVIDPLTGAPTVAFSVRRTHDDHRYWYGRWDGTTWTTEEIAPAGRALYEQESDYTGLIALDPSDAGHVVLSTDVSPLTGLPSVSATDGQRHWELWDGRRSGPGAWGWTPLTANSATDNLRPVLAAHEGGASALLWLRGTYRSYVDYEVDVVGVVRRANGTTVAARAPAMVPVTDVVPTPAPRSEAGRPVVGRFDGHPADDLYLVRAGVGPEDLLLGDERRHPTPVAARPVTSSAVPVPGDYDGNGRTDLYWYAPGDAVDSLWTTTGTAGFVSSRPRQVRGSYTPIAGDFDGNGRDDIFWYAPGPATDHLWRSDGSGFTTSTAPPVAGRYTVFGGDFDGDGRDDLFWYAPGPAADHLWFGAADGTFTTTPVVVNGVYTPIPGDYDGDGRDDIFWYAPGTGREFLWFATAPRGFRSSMPAAVQGRYVPIVGDLDGDGADDIHWYAPGPATDHLWSSSGGPLATRQAAPVNL